MSEISPFRSLMNYYPLERIATSHLLTRGIVTTWRRLSLPLHYPGRLSPPRDDCHPSCITLGRYLPLEGIIDSHTLPRGDYLPLGRIITNHALPWGIMKP